MTKAVFVAGTSTGIGKTLVSKWLCLQWPADYFKPIQSGLDGPTDTDCVTEGTTIEAHPEAYRLRAPLSPHESARLEGKRITLDQIALPQADRLVIEGAGGVLVPINETELMTDLMVQFQVPTLVVASSQLGTINHTLLTLQALAQRKINCLGVVLSGPPNKANRKAIEHYGQIPVLAELPQLENASAKCLAGIALPSALAQALNN